MNRSLVLAGTVLLGLTGMALADTATTNGVFVNIRSGPGTKYPVTCLAWPGVRFTVTDGHARTPVVFRDLLPDLFREGSGVVADGRLQGRTFVADRILAKHDERYMPPELGNLAAEHKAGKTLEK